MSAVIDKALDYIDSMNTSTSAPHAIDESRAKAMFKFLKSHNSPLNADDIYTRGAQKGWDSGFTKKMAGWADKIATGGRVVVKHPEYFSEKMQEELRSLL